MPDTLTLPLKLLGLVVKPVIHYSSITLRSAVSWFWCSDRLWQCEGVCVVRKRFVQRFFGPSAFIDNAFVVRIEVVQHRCPYFVPLVNSYESWQLGFFCSCSVLTGLADALGELHIFSYYRPLVNVVLLPHGSCNPFMAETGMIPYHGYILGELLDVEVH